MCGIYGYIGKQNAVKQVISGLEKLEYRGYDSAGLAYFNKKQNIEILKAVGKVENLKKLVKQKFSSLAIAHTRWATHGKPALENCHPHTSKNFAVVHNGIIENYQELKKEITEKLYSNTDTEIIAKLLEKYYKKSENIEENNKNILNSIKNVAKKLKGSWAVALIVKNNPKKIYVIKNKSPLIVATNGLESFVSSDINAISGNKNLLNYFSLNDGNIAEISEENIVFYNENLEKVVLEKTKKTCFLENNLKYYSHKMLKEINEIPFAIKTTKKRINNSIFKKFINNFNNFSAITIIGCGTAYHAGLYGKFIIEKMLEKKVSVELASEYRYKTQIRTQNELVLAISQSGETADTIAALEIAKQNGACVAVITNVCGSSITRICDYVFLTHAGQETAVAATKSYVSQVFVLYKIACAVNKKRIARCLEKKAEETILRFNEPSLSKFYDCNKFFFIGRLCDYSTAMEGSLKIKEISYVQSEGYPAGELKHGTLSLVDDNSLVVAIITQKSIKEKTLNAVHEVKARGAKVLIVTQFDGLENEGEVLKIPKCNENIISLLSVIPLQLFAYHFSVFKGLNPDKPRNLAKSVTVE